ncbi:hypothetical protein EME01_59130 [Sinorhizobium meliloti]|nr:hypothetical protein EME01_59130 [Sinorhizobium meliloti]
MQRLGAIVLLASRLTKLQRPFNGFKHRRARGRLFEKVMGASLHRPHSNPDIATAGEEDDRQERCQIGKTSLQLQAG